MSSKDRRRALRAPANNLISYKQIRADKLYKYLGLAVTLDLSTTGLRVRVTEPLPLGDVLTFTIKLANACYEVRGRIRWGSEIEDDRLYEFGIQFKDMDFSLAKDLWKATETALADTPLDGYSISGVLENLDKQPVIKATARNTKATSPELVLTIEAPAPETGKTFREKMPTPKPRGMVGHFEGDQLVEFVQMLGVQAKTGVVEIGTRKGDAFLALREGMIIAARTEGGDKGEDAIYRILTLKEGHFDFWPHSLNEVKAEHSLSVQSMLLEVMRRRDVPEGTAPA
ncbi:MAG TPA: DUF4388 domain-containing protein [Planctomycetota bacterium]|nr:DUF4388 domain-containing protein [Planctomycetota bacterium]